MRVLSNLTLKNLKLNKSRTIVTLVGVILSTALLVALSGLVSSFLYTMEKMAIADNGQQHVIFFDVPKDELTAIEFHKETAHYYRMETLGSFSYSEDAESESDIVAFDENAFKENESKITSGRYPQNDTEVLLDDDPIYKDVKIGDDFTLPNGKTYKVVGKTINTKSIIWNMPVFLYMNEVENSAHIAVTYKHPKNYEAITESIVGENIKYDYSYNDDVLLYETGKMSEGTQQVLFGFAFIIAFIIIVTSVYCIRNSFAISITEKIRQYGMLASVGATPKQIRKNVLFEGFILGIIGIPIGILSGVLAAIVLIEITNNLLTGTVTTESLMILHINPWFVVFAVVLSALTIFLSSISSAIKAGRISEIDAIRSTNDIKIKSKKLKTPKYIGKLFGIGGVFAHKNIKRNKKKFRTTTISLVVSIATFITLSSFLDLGFQMSNSQFMDVGSNLQIKGEDALAVYEKLSTIEDIKAKNYTVFYHTLAENGFDDSFNWLPLYKMDDDYYYNYLKNEGIEYDEDKVVLLDITKMTTEEGKLKLDNFIQSDSEVSVFSSSDPEKKNILSFNFIRPKNYPMGFYEGYGMGILMSSQQFDKYATNKSSIEFGYIYIDCDKPYETEEIIADYADENGFDIAIYNIEDNVKAQENMLLLISIFLYGFITVIILVGLTNIFNSLSTNMNLRRKEFATLMSVGMTKKEFSKMINFECVSYVLKSLAWGVPLGVLGSYALYTASLYGNVEYTYILPFKQIVIAAVVVFFVVYAIMKTSLGKISKQNIIETIRNENI